MLLLLNKRKVHFLVVFAGTVKGQRAGMVQGRAGAHSPLGDGQCQSGALPGCRALVFVARQPECSVATERHSRDRPHSRDSQKDKPCDHSDAWDLEIWGCG